MQVEVLVEQIKGLKQRIHDILSERTFFGLPPIKDETPTLDNLEHCTIVELDEHFHYCLVYYDNIVSQLKKEKTSSPSYQRSLGINAVLVSLGVGISNFNVHDVDKAAVKQMYSLCIERILSLEQQVLNQVMQSRFSGYNRIKNSCTECSDFLEQINTLIKEIQRLESFKDTQKTLPIPDARHYLYSEK